MEWLVPYRLVDPETVSGKRSDSASEPTAQTPSTSTTDVEEDPAWWEAVLIAASRMWAGAW
jgi:hypothetical protein